MIRKILLYALCCILPATLPACSSDDSEPGQEKPLPPEPEPQPEMEKMLWLDASANIQRFASRANIRHFLDLVRQTGFNKIIVDVKPTQGDVLYASDFMHRVESLNGEKVYIDWDYLQYFIDQAEQCGLKVTVSTTFFPMGKQTTREGEVYRDKKWDGKTCLQYTPDGMVDIRDDASKVAAFLNPVLPEVQEYLLRMVREIVTRYDFDAYALDYCRYPDGQSDFSQASREAFEKYIGQSVERFPEDIFTYDRGGNMVPGKYYSQWWAFRAKVIRDFIARVRETVKSVKPDVKIEYWAASWWQAIYVNGQNWASPSFDPTQEGSWSWVSPEYAEGGFADQIDTFLLGAYLNVIYGPGNPSSIEYAIDRAYRLIGDDCRIYGTISCADRNFDIAEAVYACMMRTKGLMVFDIVHVINNKMWDKIKEGIDRAEAELAAQAGSTQQNTVL